MAFRDIRNLTEMLRVLGYPHLVSFNSFRNPNFPLTADLLVWLSKRFDQDADIPLQIETVEDRVAFLRQIAEFMATKADIKLNTKRLYQADGYVVKELLKITTMLHEALKSNSSNKLEYFDDDDGIDMRDYDLTTRIDDLKHSRTLASEITTAGASLYDLLGKESEIRAVRQKSLARQLEVGQVETAIRESITEMRKEIEDTRQLIENVASTEANLDSKIERRKVEIDRYEKRLQTLKKVRPAFMEEFSSLEVELEQLFVQYSTRLRCLNYLERLASDAERAHTLRQQVAASKRATAVVPLHGEGEVDILSLDEGEEQKLIRPERPRAGTGGRNRDGKTKIDATNIGDSGSSLDLSSDSDSELFLDKDEDELDQSDDDQSLGLELSGLEMNATGGGKRSSLTRMHLQQNESDEDF